MRSPQSVLIALANLAKLAGGLSYHGHPTSPIAGQPLLQARTRLSAQSSRQLLAFVAARNVSSSGPSEPITSQGTPRESNPADPVTRTHIPAAQGSAGPASPVHPSLSTSQTVDAITRTTSKGGIGGAGVAFHGGETGPGPNGNSSGNGGAAPEPKIIIERVKRGKLRTWVVRFARGVLAIVLGGGAYIIYSKPIKVDENGSAEHEV